MSCRFYADYDETLWFPSNITGRLFHGHAQTAATLVGTESGLSDVIADECEIDPAALSKLTASLLDLHSRTNKNILKSMLVSTIAISMVLTERAGASLPDLDPTDAESWALLRQEYSKSMPRE